MTSKKLLICDTNELYAAELGNYVMTHMKNVDITIFTTTEGFFADKTIYDVGIFTEEFYEVYSFKEASSVRFGYLLVEDLESEKATMKKIYRYKPIDEIVGEIHELDDCRKSNRERKIIENSFVTGIYSPVNHELSMPFALSLCKNYQEKGTVLFVDLEEISIMTDLIGDNGERNLSDFLYFISGSHSEKKYDDYISRYGNIDYFKPFENPEEISEIDTQTWLSFFSEVAGMGYDNVVVLFGRSLTGFVRILENLNQLILLGKQGDYYQKSMDAFMRYVRNSDLNIPIVNTYLPMTAANLSDGTYRMDELLQGKLGVYVRKLIIDGSILISKKQVS